MKITADSPLPPIARQPIDARGEKAASGTAKQAAEGKPTPEGDRIDLLSSHNAAQKVSQAQQAKRVESIKALVKSGKYEVNSQAVAEKMLSIISTK